jgi:hypothetical protein
MKLVVFFVMCFGPVAVAQSTGAASSQGTCSAANTGNNSTVTVTCHNVDKKLADLIGQLVTASKRDGKTLKDISEKLDALLDEIQSQQTTTTVISINQQGGVTAGIININALPQNPGFGMLLRQDLAYTGKPLVYLERKQISADDKPVGTVYVSVFLSLRTQYERKKNEDTIQNTLKTLTEIPGVVVFFSPAPGGYTLVKDGVATTTGGNIAGVGESTGVFYFDKSSEMIASRIKDSLHFNRAALLTLSSNPSNPGLLLNYDIWKVSGMDIEVVL